MNDDLINKLIKCKSGAFLKKKEKIKTRQLGSFDSCWDCSVLEAALGNDCERALGNIFLLHWLVHQWYEAEVEQPSRELIYDSFAAILFLSYSSCRLSSHLLWSSHTYTRNTNLINIFVQPGINGRVLVINKQVWRRGAVVVDVAWHDTLHFTW